jgi:exocyst complex component 4
MPNALSSYLSDLKMRPAADVSFSVPDDPRHSILDTNSHPKGHSRNTSLSTPTPVRPSSTVDPTSTITTPENIESNSFLYIEMILEALAVLGALGGALDSVNQRLGVEIFGLVESVIGDVHERAEFVRRGLEQSPSNTVITTGGGPNNTVAGGLYVFVGEGPGALRLAALEGAAKKADHEILRDLCWTLYSKLDAVVQGLRVVSEVADRIGSVSR